MEYEQGMYALDLRREEGGRTRYRAGADIRGLEMRREEAAEGARAKTMTPRFPSRR